MRRAILLTAALASALLLIILGAAPARAQSVQLVPFGGQTYASPYYVTGEPGNPGRVYVVEGAGTIRLVEDGATKSPAFLDISGEVCFSGEATCGPESGMVSMAFAPDYATSGRFYVFFTRDVDPGTHELVVREFRRTTSPNDIDEATGRDVLVIAHPTNTNHNGGQLQFGPDGYLYISTGDGGGANDPGANAQNLNSLLGKLLRIDPTGTVPLQHGIPPDNPFAGSTPGADEIYSYGLRNPYRFSFDRLTGDLTIGDVGQAEWEEVDFVTRGVGRGANFGWDCFEGTALGASSGEPQCTPLPTNHTPPVLQYANPPASNAAINGGYMVRDETIPTLLGRYLYADSSSAFPEIRSAVLFPGGSSGDSSTGLAGGTASFGEDTCGHIYVAHFNGQVSRIQPSTATPACQPQATLPTPGAGGDGGDTRGPALSVDLSKAKRAAARGELTLIVRCDENCTLTGTGKVVLSGKDIGLEPDDGTLAAAVPGVLGLDLSRRKSKRLGAELRDGGKAKALLSLIGTDAAGNQSAAKYRVRQRR
jgi:glucose/arabinose dehydrogenase